MGGTEAAALRAAVEAGDESETDRLVRENNCKREALDALAVLAASEGHARVYALLLRSGASVRAVSGYDGKTALHYACENGHVELLELLLRDSNAPTSARDSNKATPLHAAARAAFTEGVRQLLARLPVNAVDLLDDDECSALKACCDTDCSSTARVATATMLLNAGARTVAPEHDSPLSTCVTRGNSALFHLLLARCLAEQGADAERELGHVLALCAYKGHSDMFDSLLALRAAWPQDDLSIALCDAAETGNEHIARAALGRGADVHFDEEVALFRACACGQVDMVQLLCDAGADPNAHSADVAEHALATLCACNLDRAELARGAQILLDAGADPMHVNEGGRTVLHAAAGAGLLALTRICLARGADVNARTLASEQTPLMAVAGAWHDTHDVLRLLLAQPGIEVDAQGSSCMTALMIATMATNVEAVQVLAEAGADVNKANRSGASPFLLCALTGRARMLPMLAALGADPDATSANGSSALWTAVRACRRSVMRAAVAAGATSQIVHEDADLSVRCWRGHALEAVSRSCTCDACGRSSDPGPSEERATDTRCCRECNFDVCGICWDRRGRVVVCAREMAARRHPQLTEDLDFAYDNELARVLRQAGLMGQALWPVADSGLRTFAACRAHSGADLRERLATIEDEGVRDRVVELLRSGDRADTNQGRTWKFYNGRWRKQ